MPPWFEYMENFVKDRLVYMTGRGLMSMAFLGLALAVPGIGLTPLALTAIGLTGVLQGALVWRDQRRSEEKLINEYRDEIAARTGVNPERVGLEDLRTVAYGDEEQGIEENVVLRQAIERSGQKKLLRLGSTILSAVVALTAVSLFMPPEALHGLAEWVRQSTGGWLASNTTIFGAMLVSGTGMGLLNNFFDYVGEPVLGLDVPTAHSQIKAMNLDISRNKQVSKERVFGVFVAADQVLGRAIEEAYGKPYYRLSIIEQQHATNEFGRHYPIEQLTHDINARQVQPDELAFAAVGQQSGVKRVDTPKAMGEERSAVDEAVDMVRGAFAGRDARTEAPVIAKPEPEAVPAPAASFAERYARKTEDGPLKHAERELLRRSEALDQLPTLH